MKYLTPKQHLRRLRFERFTNYIKTLLLVSCGTLALWILIAIKPDFGFNDRFNGCLQKHDLNYCNKAIK